MQPPSHPVSGRLEAAIHSSAFHMTVGPLYAWQVINATARAVVWLTATMEQMRNAGRTRDQNHLILVDVDALPRR